MGAESLSAYFHADIVSNKLHIRFKGKEILFNDSSIVHMEMLKIIEKADADEIILDIENVESIDSSAIGLFLSLNSSIKKRNKRFRLENIKESVKSCFDLLNVHIF